MLEANLSFIWILIVSQLSNWVHNYSPLDLNIFFNFWFVRRIFLLNLTSLGIGGQTPPPIFKITLSNHWTSIPSEQGRETEKSRSSHVNLAVE